MTTPLFIPEIFQPFDDLLERRTRLQQMTTIPDMPFYAQEWADLAADFEFCGLLSNAAYCKARASHYAEMEPGTYTRVFSPPFALLARV